MADKYVTVIAQMVRSLGRFFIAVEEQAYEEELEQSPRAQAEQLVLEVVHQYGDLFPDVQDW